MPTFEFLVMAAVAALLVTAVFAARRRRVEPPLIEAPPVPEPVAAQPPPPPKPAPPPYTPAEGSVMVSQLEVGQTVHIQTVSARYSLTLIDPGEGIYDAIRIARSGDAKPDRRRFRMYFFGTLVPARRFLHGWFAVGGRLSYYKCGKDGQLDGPITSMAVQRVIFSIPLKQAS